MRECIRYQEIMKQAYSFDFDAVDEMIFEKLITTSNKIFLHSVVAVKNLVRVSEYYSLVCSQNSDYT